jgi:peptidyl-prolyl cis-trans isomerase SurA
MQQGAQAGIRPTPEIVQRAIAEFAGSVQSTPEELRAELSGAGINGQALEDMVVAQVIWREVVNTRFRGRIDPAEVEIDAEIDLASQNRNVSYRLQEIGLPTAENNRGEAATLALAERLVAELSAGGDFAAAARQYSRAPSARSGGVVGWVPAASLPPEMARDLAALEPGQISRPMPVQGGITILRLIEERSEDTNAVEADAALREQVRQGLVNQRLELLSQGLLQELRRDALIQLR